MAVQIQIDTTDLDKKLKKLDGIKNGAKKALTRAMNRAAAGMKTDAGRAAAQTYHITQRDVKAKINVSKANYSSLSAEINSQGRPIRAIKFRHKPNANPGKRGGTAAFLHVKKTAAGGFLTGGDGKSKAFVATMSNGMTDLFQRTGESVGRPRPRKDPVKARTGKAKSKYSGRTDQPIGRENIEQVYSPGVVQMLSEESVRGAIQSKAQERFIKELDHQISYLLNSQ